MQFYCSCYWRIAFLNMPRNQTLIQFLSVSTTLPFQISHLTLEWSNSSNSPPRPFVDRARPFPRFQTCNWSHFSSSPWKNTALQYDLWVHLTAACSEKFKVKGPKEKCPKIFLKAEEVKMLELVSHDGHILTRFPSLHGKELSLKSSDWAPRRRLSLKRGIKESENRRRRNGERGTGNRERLGIFKIGNL